MFDSSQHHLNELYSAKNFVQVNKMNCVVAPFRGRFIKSKKCVILYINVHSFLIVLIKFKKFKIVNLQGVFSLRAWNKAFFVSFIDLSALKI